MKKLLIVLLALGSISAFAQSSTERTECFKVDRLIYNAVEKNYEVRDNSQKNYTSIDPLQEEVLGMAKVAIASNKSLCLTMDPMVSRGWIKAEVKH